MKNYINFKFVEAFLKIFEKKNQYIAVKEW